MLGPNTVSNLLAIRNGEDMRMAQPSGEHHWPHIHISHNSDEIMTIIVDDFEAGIKLASLVMEAAQIYEVNRLKRELRDSLDLQNVPPVA